MVGEATYRIWRLYMAGSAYDFDEGSTNVYQVLAAPVHQPLVTPLRRDDLYNLDPQVQVQGIALRNFPPTEERRP